MNDPVGIVTIPTVFPAEGAFGDLKKKSVPLKATPTNTASVTVNLSEPSQVKSIEYGYETLAAWVYGSQPGWYQLMLSNGGLAWVAATDAGKFIPIQILIGPKAKSMFWVKTSIEFFSTPAGAPAPKPEILRRQILGLYQLENEKQPVFVSPDTTSKKLTDATIYGSLAMLQGVCPCGVIITDQKGDWLQVASVRGQRSELIAERGWLKTTHKQPLQPIAKAQSLIKAQTIVYGDLPSALDVEILETKVVGDRLWAKARLDPKERCGDKAKDFGESSPFWVRVFSDSGEIQLWYASRGC